MSDYYEDEWYDDYSYEDDDEPEIWGQSYSCWLYKSPKGHLRFWEGVLTCYEGEDWGEASGWVESDYNLNELEDEAKAKLIEIGKSLKPGEYKELLPYWYEEEEEEESTAESIAPDQPLSPDSPVQDDHQ